MSAPQRRHSGSTRLFIHVFKDHSWGSYTEPGSCAIAQGYRNEAQPCREGADSQTGRQTREEAVSTQCGVLEDVCRGHCDSQIEGGFHPASSERGARKLQRRPPAGRMLELSL